MSSVSPPEMAGPTAGAPPAPPEPPAEDPNSELNILRRELRQLQATVRQSQLLTASQQDELIELRAEAAAAVAREAALEARLAGERTRVQSTMAAAESLVASLRALEAAPPVGATDDADADDGDAGEDGTRGGGNDGSGEQGDSGGGGGRVDDVTADEEPPLVVNSEYLVGGTDVGGTGVSVPAASDISAALASDRRGEATEAPRVTAENASKIRCAAEDAASGGILVAGLPPCKSPTAPAAAVPVSGAVPPLSLSTSSSQAAAAAASGAGFSAALKETTLAYVCGDAHEGDLYALAAALDGGVVASGGDDRIVRVFETASRRVVGRLTESGRAVTALSFSGGGGLLAGGSFDGIIRLYARAVHGRRKGRWALQSVLPGHTSAVRRLIFDASATEDAPRMFSASGDRSIKLTDVSAGKRPFVATAPSAVLDMDILPGSQTVVSGHKDGGLRVWSLQSGGEMPEVSAKAHARAVTSVCCLEDGYGVLTLGRDDVLKLSDMRLLGESVREMEGGVRVVSDWHRATLCGRVAACGLGPSGALAHWNVDSGKMYPRRLNAGAAPAGDGDVLRLLKSRNPGCVVLPLWTAHGLITAHKSRQLSFWQ